MPDTKDIPSLTTTGVGAASQAAPSGDESLDADVVDFHKSKDKAKLRGIVDRLTPVIDYAIKSYGRQDSPVIRDRARLMAAKAIQSYDPKGGAGVKTYVNSQLRSLGRVAAKIHDPFPASERFRQDASSILNTQKQFSDQLGRDPTDEELADLSKISVKRLLKVKRRLKPVIPMSSYELSEEDDATDDYAASTRTIEDDWYDAVYHDLGEIDQLIFQHRTGYRNSDILPNEVIANKVGLSPAAVSQRASRIQAKLDQING